MTPLLGGLGGKEVVIWRIDQRPFAASWDSGEGAFRVGGRWNTRGTRAVYCSVDPATAILEVAVHTGFATLDTVPHVLTAARIDDLSEIHVVTAADIPNPNWIRPGFPSIEQQSFGDTLLADRRFVLIPSAVSTHSWNVVFTGTLASGFYTLISQEHFALDTRLHVATSPTKI